MERGKERRRDKTLGGAAGTESEAAVAALSRKEADFPSTIAAPLQRYTFRLQEARRNSVPGGSLSSGLDNGGYVAPDSAIYNTQQPQISRHQSLQQFNPQTNPRATSPIDDNTPQSRKSRIRNIGINLDGVPSHNGESRVEWGFPAFSSTTLPSSSAFSPATAPKLSNGSRSAVAREEPSISTYTSSSATSSDRAAHAQKGSFVSRNQPLSTSSSTAGFLRLVKTEPSSDGGLEPSDGWGTSSVQRRRLERNKTTQVATKNPGASPIETGRSADFPSPSRASLPNYRTPQLETQISTPSPFFYSAGGSGSALIHSNSASLASGRLTSSRIRNLSRDFLDPQSTSRPTTGYERYRGWVADVPTESGLSSESLNFVAPSSIVPGDEIVDPFRYSNQERVFKSPPQTIMKAVREGIAHYGNETALIFTESPASAITGLASEVINGTIMPKLTYNEYVEAATAFALSLLRIGFHSRQSVVHIVDQHTPELCITHLGTILATGISVILDSKRSASDFESILIDTAATVVVMENNSMLLKYAEVLDKLCNSFMSSLDSSSSSLLAVVVLRGELQSSESLSHLQSMLPLVIEFGEFQNIGLGLEDRLLWELNEMVHPDDCCLIAYGPAASTVAQGTGNGAGVGGGANGAVRGTRSASVTASPAAPPVPLTEAQIRAKKPVGLQFSHDNITFTARTLAQMINGNTSESGDSVTSTISTSDRLVAFMPLTEILSQLFEIFMPLLTGASVVLVPGDPFVSGTLGPMIQAVEPTIFFATPSIYQKLLLRLVVMESSLSVIDRNLLASARKSSLKVGKKLQFRATAAGTGGSSFAAKLFGRRNSRRKSEANVTNPSNLKHVLISGYMMSKMKRAIGMDKCRAAFSSLAPLSVKDICHFVAIGLPIYEIYSSSACTGIGTLNRPLVWKLGTLGREISGSVIRVDSVTQEIKYKGRNVFIGYVNDPYRTQQAFDPHGWLRLSEKGYIDKDGCLTVLHTYSGRLVTADGSVVYPEDVEALVMRYLPEANSVIVIGEGRPFLIALIVIKTSIPERRRRYTMDSDGMPFVRSVTGATYTPMSTAVTYVSAAAPSSTTSAVTTSTTGSAPTQREEYGTSSTSSLAPEVLKRSSQLGSKADTIDLIILDPKWGNYIDGAVRKANSSIAEGHKKISRWALLTETLSVETGEISEAGELQRLVIESRFQDVIDSLYT